MTDKQPKSNNEYVSLKFGYINLRVIHKEIQHVPLIFGKGNKYVFPTPSVIGASGEHNSDIFPDYMGSQIKFSYSP